MFERFTKAARATVERALTVAQEATAGEVRPEHLLAALLEQEDCLAVRVLAGLGAPPAEVREVLDGLRMRYVDGLDDDDAEALQLALREAIALRHNDIGTEHLLLGLARQEDRVVADTLGAFGIERAALRSAVAAAVRRAG